MLGTCYDTCDTNTVLLSHQICVYGYVLHNCQVYNAAITGLYWFTAVVCHVTLMLASVTVTAGEKHIILSAEPASSGLNIL